MSLLEVKLLYEGARVPTRAHAFDAGLDLYAAKKIILWPREVTQVPLGIALAIPAGFVGLIRDRSSLAAMGVTVVGGVLDSGYRGEVSALLFNTRPEEVVLNAGNKVAQLLVLPVSLCSARWVDEFNEPPPDNRGQGGFGSTGE